MRNFEALTPKKALLLQRWQQILTDSALDRYDDDYRIETDADGRILFVPKRQILLGVRSS